MFFAVHVYRQLKNICPWVEDYGISYIFFHHHEWESNQVDSPRITEEMREKTAHLTFLIHSYEPQMCWFEVFESMRRLMLSSMLILIDPGSSAQIVVAILICLVSIKFYSFYLPFVEDSDDVLAEAAQWQTFCVFFSALLIRVDATGESPSSQMLLSMLLIVIVTSGSLLMSGIILYEIFIENEELKEGKKKELVDDAKALGGENDEEDTDVNMQTDD